MPPTIQEEQRIIRMKGLNDGGEQRIIGMLRA